MILMVEKDKTLLVDGPARVHLLSGKASVLGALIETGEEIIVRKGKRLPLEPLCISKFELTLGDSASYAETEGSSIPLSWRNAVNHILSGKGPKIVLILGGVDSGKTSFCTFLANLALNARYRVAVIDGDPGQSDIGPPGTVSLSFVREPIMDLFKSKPETLVFIGVTSPSKEIGAILEALGTLKDEASKKGAYLLIINTDGWVEGEGAVDYKVRLVKTIAPNIVVAIQNENELASILSELSGVEAHTVDSPKEVKKRDRETRKLLRESAYKKHLREAKVRSFPSSWIEIDGDLTLGTENRPELKSRIEEIIGTEVLHCEETSNYILFFLGRQTRLREEELMKLEAELGKKAVSLHEGEEEGILVAMENADGKVLGIGTIHSVDYEKRTIRICTPVQEAVSKIRVGRIKLDREGNEIGWMLESL